MLKLLPSLPSVTVGEVSTAAVALSPAEGGEGAAASGVTVGRDFPLGAYSNLSLREGMELVQR